MFYEELGFKSKIKCTKKPDGQPRMDNPEKLAISVTQDTGRRQTNKKHNTDN